MEKKKQLEYLNTLRFMAVIFIVFAHFNYQVFGKIMEKNILDSFFYNKSLWTYYLLSGFKGKYAVAMMCIISGFLTTMKFRDKKVEFSSFIFKRYIRLMLPIIFVNTIFVVIRKITGYNYSLHDYLLGILYPGSITINDHLYCIGEFFIGNILIGIILDIIPNKKIQAIIFVLMLPILYKMEKIWVMAILIGALTYAICEYLKERHIFKYVYILILIPLIWYLPIGTESNKLYFRCATACAISIISIYCLPILEKIFNCNRLKTIKKSSYSIFVVHGLINTLIGEQLVMNIQRIFSVENLYILEIITFIVLLVIDLIISMIINYLIENKLYKKIVTLVFNKNIVKEGEKE